MHRPDGRSAPRRVAGSGLHPPTLAFARHYGLVIQPSFVILAG